MAKVVQILRAQRARLDAIEREAQQLRKELQQIRDAVGRSATKRGGSPRRRARVAPAPVSPTSPLGRALAVLQASRRPLHIEVILRSIARRFGERLKRRAVESQLARYAQKGRLVRQTGPAEFALLASRKAPTARARP